MNGQPEKICMVISGSSMNIIDFLERLYLYFRRNTIYVECRWATSAVGSKNVGNVGVKVYRAVVPTEAQVTTPMELSYSK